MDHKEILNGIIDFSKGFKGTLVTETMLVEGVNDHDSSIEKIAAQRPMLTYAHYLINI